MDTVSEKLIGSAQRGNQAEIEALLLDPACDPLAKNYQGLTALIWAAVNGHLSCVQLLLPVSDALVKNAQGMTALMLTAYFGHDSCVGVLFPMSDATANDDRGMTALMWAAEHVTGLAASFCSR